MADAHRGWPGDHGDEALDALVGHARRLSAAAIDFITGAETEDEDRASPSRVTFSAAPASVSEPPSAMIVMTAFFNAFSVRISRGFRSSQTISTMRLPDAEAMRI